MTVSVQTPYELVVYSGPGYYYAPFGILKHSELRVVYIDTNGVRTPLVLDTDYTVVDQTNNGVGITTSAPTATDGQLELTRLIDKSQEVDWVNNNFLDVELIEDSFDKITLIMQDLAYGYDDVYTQVANAESAAVNAQNAQTAAETAQANAETAQANAETAQACAQEWASNDEDVPVSCGTGYSAKHWAAKSAIYAEQSTRENLILNGSLNIWQRGTTFTNGGFNADRWATWFSGGTATITRANQDIDVPRAGRYFMSINHQVAASPTDDDYCRLLQKCLNVRLTAGKVLYLSFWASGLAGSKIWIAGGQGDINGNKATDFDGQEISLTTTMTKYEVWISYPAVTPADLFSWPNWFAIRIWISAGANTPAASIGQQTGNFYFSDFRACVVEQIGDKAPIRQRTFLEELELCEFFFQKTYAIDVAPGNTGYVGAVTLRNDSASSKTTLYGGKITFNHRMLRAPTVTLYSPATGASGNIRLVSAGVDSTAAVTDLNETGFSGIWNIAASAAANEVASFHYTAQAEL